MSAISIQFIIFYVKISMFYEVFAEIGINWIFYFLNLLWAYSSYTAWGNISDLFPITNILLFSDEYSLKLYNQFVTLS